MIHNDVENDDNWVASDDDEEEAPMRCSFSVEDLLDEVEKICYDASGTSKVEMVVRLWKDGFTVNDQEFRSYSVPENQQFLDAIKRGELPAEWESRAEEEELEVNVEDLTEEAYVPKKKVFHPFSGRGYRLGSVAPRVVARSPSVHEDGESPPIPMVTLDHALPVTSLQIWLADGRRLVQRFNLSHRQHGGTMVSAHASRPRFLGSESSCVEFTCSPRDCVGSLASSDFQRHAPGDRLI
ncbi:UBX domain-containing protein 2A isoform X2 [Nerophis lumbriciformis]|uniref:UBX domain-containing protein 2A isoform X2 n=1 Tax=Nerophis lumbriciformis TaxID=546530 RepID=UPI002ADFC5A9|nr:UBX domain-containing protein 2A-like isoform X2 [Nerophis lumbriciformis]